MCKRCWISPSKMVNISKIQLILHFESKGVFSHWSLLVENTSTFYIWDNNKWNKTFIKKGTTSCSRKKLLKNFIRLPSMLWCCSLFDVLSCKSTELLLHFPDIYEINITLWRWLLPTSNVKKKTIQKMKRVGNRNDRAITLYVTQGSK